VCRGKSIRTLGRIMKFGRQRRHSSELPASPQFVDAADNLGILRASLFHGHCKQKRLATEKIELMLTKRAK